MRALSCVLVLCLASVASAQGFWAVPPGQGQLLGDWNTGSTIHASGPGWSYRQTGIQPTPIIVAPGYGYRPVYGPRYRRPLRPLAAPQWMNGYAVPNRAYGGW